MIQELIDYHKTKMRLAEAEGRTDDYKFHKAAIELLSKPSLPSNLDEAAEDSWAIYEYRESPKGLYSTCYIDGFKAGAEWVSGQGETIEGEVVKDINNNLVVKAKGLSMKDVKFGDKVIVQIRKK